MMSAVKLSFDVLVEEHGDYRVARCLQTGTVSVGRDEYTAMHKMCKMLERLVVFALKNRRIESIFEHPAPKEFHARRWSDKLLCNFNGDASGLGC